VTQIEANGISIEYEQDGDSEVPAILLICGLGMQLTYWSPALVQRLTEGGFQVLRFDNRDAGLSQKFGDFDDDLQYSITDMAADAVGVLDALGINRAHVVGRSMGGVIAQPLAAEYPHRVASLTIIMSTSHAPGLPDPAPEVRELLQGGPEDPDDPDQILDFILAGDYAWGSPKYPFDETTRRAENARAYERCYDPDGSARQYSAMMASGSCVSHLRNIVAPALVIHGTHDTLVSLEHGRSIASHIPGAKLMEIEGMGHNLDGDLSLIVADAIVAHIRKLRDSQKPSDH